MSQTEAIAWYLKNVRTLEIKHIPVLFRVWVRLRWSSCWTWSHVSSQQFARLLNLLNPFLKRQTITPSLYKKFFLTSFPCKISSIVHFIRILPLEGVRWFLVMPQRVLTGIQKKERGKAGYLCKAFFFVSSQTRTAPIMFIAIPGNREVFVDLEGHITPTWRRTVQPPASYVVCRDALFWCNAGRGSELISDAKVRVVLRNPTQTSSLFPLLRVPSHRLLVALRFIDLNPLIPISV